MYAIVLTGGKQYRVQAGDRLRVEKLQMDLGTEYDITDVLLIGGDKTIVGRPMVANAKVTAVVTQQKKDSKVIVFKKKRRQGYRRLKGHRQSYTELFIKSITSPDGDVSKTDVEAKVGNVDPKKPTKKPRGPEAKAASAEPAKKAAKKATKKAAKKTTKKKTTKKATKKAAAEDSATAGE